MVPKMAIIRGIGSLRIRLYVRDPEKAHPCAEPRVLAYFASKSVQRPWLLRVAMKMTGRFEIFESDRHFRMESNRDVRFEFESNLEATQVPTR